MNTRDLLNLSRDLDEGKSDYYVATEDVTFRGAEHLFLDSPQATLWNNTYMSHIVEDHALGQICDKLGPPPRDYMRKCPAWLTAENLNHWCEGSDKEWMVRTAGDNVRAVVSGLYAPVENTWILETLDEFLGGQAREVVNSQVTRDGLWARVLFGMKEIDIPGFNQPDAYASGIYFANSEIGLSSVKILPFVMRTSCTNSTIWFESEYGVVERHIGRNRRRTLRAMIKDRLGVILGASNELLDKIVEAEIEEIPDPIPLIDKFLADHGYTDVRDHVLQGMVNDTRAGIHHGLTFAANFIEDPYRQERLQMAAGSFLFGKRLAYAEKEEA